MCRLEKPSLSRQPGPAGLLQSFPVVLSLPLARCRAHEQANVDNQAGGWQTQASHGKVPLSGKAALALA